MKIIPEKMVHTKFDIYMIFRVPDEDYSEKMVHTKFDIYMILRVPDEDYSRKDGAH